MTEQSALEFKGRDGHGSFRMGRTSRETPAELAERCYIARWQSLIVNRDGVEVAGISLHPDTQKRIWWGDPS